MRTACPAIVYEPRDETSPPRNRARSRFVLDEILHDSFEDAVDRRAVLVLGAGLLRELAETERRSAWIDPNPRWGSFLSWPALGRRVSAIDGGDEPGAKAARLLDPPAAHEMTLMQLGYRLREARFRDIVTLDVDSTIEAALRSVGFAMQTEATRERAGEGREDAAPGVIADRDRIARRRLEVRSTFVSLDGEQTIRVWHPRGRVAEPETVRLRRDDVDATLRPVEQALADHDARRATFFSQWRGPSGSADRAFLESLRAARTAELAPSVSPLRTWVDLFASSDLVFAGTRLARAEHDLWWALRRRVDATTARSPVPRQRALFLAASGTVPAQIASNDVGLEVVEYPSNRELRAALFGPSVTR